MNRISGIIVASVISCLLTVGILYAMGFGQADANTLRIEHADAVAAQQARFTPGASEAAPPASAPFDFTFAAERVAPAVVFIRNTMTGEREEIAQQGSPEDLFRQFFGPGFGGPEGMTPRRGGPRPSVGSGSGVLISPDGYIVTNNHVIDNAADLEVRVGDKDTYKATLVGTDPTTDIALLKIEADAALPFVEFADSDQVRIGQWVAAVGNPFDLATTVTAGIVSAKGRSINIIGRGGQGRSRDRTAIESFIQTDAAVNPGNSGGALVDTDGRLIGINTAIASPTGAYSGYSFAVPSRLVRKVMDDLRDFGQVQRGFIGASIVEVNQAFADDRGLDINYGVYVDSLMANSSAKAAGLQKGDIIVAIDGTPVRTNPGLLSRIGRKRPGDVVALTYLRDGSERVADVTLKGANGGTERVVKQASKRMAKLGIDVEAIDAATASRLGVRGGVRVTDVRGGVVDRQTDMSPGFVITRAGDRAVNSVEDFERAVRGARGILVVRGRYPDVDGEKKYAFDPS